jgi:hypothetical protein
MLKSVTCVIYNLWSLSCCNSNSLTCYQFCWWLTSVFSPKSHEISKRKAHRLKEEYIHIVVIQALILLLGASYLAWGRIVRNGLANEQCWRLHMTCCSCNGVWSIPLCCSFVVKFWFFSYFVPSLFWQPSPNLVQVWWGLCTINAKLDSKKFVFAFPTDCV